MNRLTRESMFMRIAHVVSERSTCARLNVGAVIVQNNRIVSIGWNGQAPGSDHCVGDQCPTLNKPGGCGTTHAELNALRHLPHLNIYSACQIYITDMPCMGCATALKQAGYITDVYFGRNYRDHSGPEYLQHHGIKVWQVMPNGIVLPWSKKS